MEPGLRSTCAFVLVAAALLSVPWVGPGPTGTSMPVPHAPPTAASSVTTTPSFVPPRAGSSPARDAGPWVPLPSFLWMVQVQFYNVSGTPYTQSDFDRFAANHYNAIELVVPWVLETSPGTYDFSLLDTYMGYAENVSLAVVVVFWYGGWTFGVTNWVPGWITSREIYSNGAVGRYPPWWNASARSDYFAFINATVTHLDPDPNFQGVYAPFGNLDFPWDIPPAGATGAVLAGYSPDTVRAYDGFLQSQYGSLASYNAAHGTSYTSWSQIPAPPPSATAAWNDFGNFRIYCVEQAFGYLTGLVHAHTNRTLFYYFGGGIGATVVGGNLEDVYFALAARYGGIVNVDDATVQLYPMLFASLAEKYKVRYIQEFTPPPGAGFYAAFNETMANTYIGRPWEVGGDFFTYNTAQTVFRWAFAFFGSLRTIAEGASPGGWPASSVAALICYYSGFYSFVNTTWANAVLSNDEGMLTQMAYLERPFVIVTDLELLNGATNLSAFSTVLDIGSCSGPAGADPYVQGDLTWFVNHGGNLVTAANSLTYLQGRPAVLQLALSPTPTWSQIDVEGSNASTQPELFLAASNWDFFSASATAESGTIGVPLASWGLPTTGSFLVQDLLAGTNVTLGASAGVLAVPWDPVPGEVDFFQIVPAASRPTITSFSVAPTVLDVGGASTLAVAAAGGTTPYAYAYTGLPSGCSSMDVATLPCTPAVAGNFSIVVTVTDAAGRAVSRAAPLTVYDVPTITAFRASPPEVPLAGTSFLNATARGGAGPLSFAYTGLPSGCSDRNVSSLPCMPSRLGNYTISATVSDRLGLTASATTWLLVYVPPTISAFTASLSPAPRGTMTYLNATASGGVGSLSYTYVGLPGGCRTADVAALACTPLSVGTFLVRVFANDSASHAATATLPFSVVPALLQVAITPANASVASGAAVGLRASPSCSGGTCPPGLTFTWSLNDTLGSLSSATGNATTFQAGAQAGRVRVSVSVTQGRTVVRGNASITVTGPPGSGTTSTTWPPPLVLGMVTIAAASVIVVAFLAWRVRARRRRPPSMSAPAPGRTSAGEGAPGTSPGELPPEGS